MLCRKCLKEIPDDVTACPHCGEHFEDLANNADKPHYNPFSGPPVDTPTSQLNYAALTQHYKQATKRPPRNIFFWAAKVLIAAALICFFMPFISGSLNLFNVYDSEKYSGYEYMLEAKSFLQHANDSVFVDDAGVAGAWITLLILAIGFVFMLASLILRRGYGTLALGTLAVYSIFFAIIKAIGSDDTLNHAADIRPGAGLIVNMVLMVAIFVFAVIDRNKARAEIRHNLGIV